MSVDPRSAGITAGGLPYPNDDDPVMLGAQAIKSLAQAVETKIIGGSPQSVYEALRNLGAPAGSPIAWTYDPELGGGWATYTPANNALQMVAVTVPHVYTCTGVGMVTSAVGSGYPGSVYNGCGLWQYASDGSATFLRDTGPSNGTQWTVLGLAQRPWVTPIQLSPGVAYLVGFTQQSSVPNMAVIRGLGGSQVNAGMSAPFLRSVQIANAGATQAAVMKTWPAASMTGGQPNLPLMILY